MKQNIGCAVRIGGAWLNEREIGRLKPIIDELAPKLNAYLKSIGRVPYVNY